MWFDSSGRKREGNEDGRGRTGERDQGDSGDIYLYNIKTNLIWGYKCESYRKWLQTELKIWREGQHV